MHAGADARSHGRTDAGAKQDANGVADRMADGRSYREAYARTHRRTDWEAVADSYR